VICKYAGIVGPTQHDMLTAVATAREPNLAAICGASVSAACRDRYNVLKSLYNAGNTQFMNAETDARDRTNSIIFNAFIFCQVRLIMLLVVWNISGVKLYSIINGFHVCLQMFNQINARKVEDEYNVFQGLHKSRIFIYIWVFVVAVQASEDCSLEHPARLRQQTVPDCL